MRIAFFMLAIFLYGCRNDGPIKVVPPTEKAFDSSPYISSIISENQARGWKFISQRLKNISSSKALPDTKVALITSQNEIDDWIRLGVMALEAESDSLLRLQLDKIITKSKDWTELTEQVIGSHPNAIWVIFDIREPETLEKITTLFERLQKPALIIASKSLSKLLENTNSPYIVSQPTSFTSIELQTILESLIETNVSDKIVKRMRAFWPKAADAKTYIALARHLKQAPANSDLLEQTNQFIKEHTDLDLATIDLQIKRAFVDELSLAIIDANVALNHNFYGDRNAYREFVHGYFREDLNWLKIMCNEKHDLDDSIFTIEPWHTFDCFRGALPKNGVKSIWPFDQQLNQALYTDTLIIKFLVRDFPKNP